MKHYNFKQIYRITRLLGIICIFIAIYNAHTLYHAVPIFYQTLKLTKSLMWLFLFPISIIAFTLSLVIPFLTAYYLLYKTEVSIRFLGLDYFSSDYKTPMHLWHKILLISTGMMLFLSTKIVTYTYQTNYQTHLNQFTHQFNNSFHIKVLYLLLLFGSIAGFYYGYKLSKQNKIAAPFS